MAIQQLTVSVKEIRQETPEAYTYVLENITGEPIVYQAGQFLTLLLTINDKEERRSYSFSSSPGIDKDPAITIKRVVNGFVSRYIIDHFTIGYQVKTLAPAGRFVIEENKDTVCFITAGSGITPIYSLIKDILHNHKAERIVLIYQNRNESTAIFRKTLLLLQQAYPTRFYISEIFSAPNDHTIHPKRLNNYMLEKLINSNFKTGKIDFYISGPAAFIRMAEFTLKVMGFESEVIKKENFEVQGAAVPAIPVDPSIRKVTIHYKAAEYNFNVQYPQNILQAALAHNIQLPYSCRGGRCSTCAVRLMEGEVYMSRNEVLTEKETSEGWILTCVAYARSNVILKIE